MQLPENTPPNAPFAAKKGDPLTVVLEIKWGLNMNVLHHRFTVKANGKLVATGEGATGWDADKRQIVRYEFTSNGDRSESTGTILDTETTEEECREVSKDGVVTESTIIWKLVDRDTMTSHKKVLAINGKKLTREEPLVTWKRKK